MVKIDVLCYVTFTIIKKKKLKMIKPACHQIFLRRLGVGVVFTQHLKDLLWGEGTHGQHEPIFGRTHRAVWQVCVHRKTTGSVCETRGLV